MKKLLLSLMVVGLMSAFLPVSAVAAPGGVTNPDTAKELAQARQATNQYHDVSQAIAAGYVQVGPYVPGVGFAYLRFVSGSPDVDATFDVESPEVLLYAANGPNGRRLVGVGYVVLGPPPEGFTGSDGFWVQPPPGAPSLPPGMWGLPVWLWQGNPAGIFAIFNPNIP